MASAAKKVKLEQPGPVPVPAPVAVKPSAISQKAMLVSVTIHRWKPMSTDNKVGGEIADKHGAKDHSVGKYRKRLFLKGTFLPIATVENEIRREYWFRTLPWSDDSGRILHQTGFQDFTKKMNELTQQFHAEVKKILPDEKTYLELKAAAKVAFGALYDETLYPPYASALSKFGVEIKVNPITTGADFRVDVGDKELERLRAEIDRDRQQTIDEAMKEPFKRLQEVLAHMAKRLNAYAVDPESGKVQNTFRDSLVTNITEILDVLPSLNLTGDPALTQFGNQIRKELTEYTGMALRDDAKLRKAVAVKAEAILDKMKAYL